MPKYYQYDITLEAWTTQDNGEMLIESVKDAKTVVKSFNFEYGPMNPYVDLIFGDGYNPENYVFPYKVLKNFCPAIEYCLRQADIEVTNYTTVNLTIPVEFSRGVRVVMSWLNRYKDLIDDEGRVVGIERWNHWNGSIGPFYQAWNLCVVLGLTRLQEQIAGYIDDLLYKKGMRSWSISEWDLMESLECLKSMPRLYRDLIILIARAKEAGVLQNKRKIMRYLREEYSDAAMDVIDYVCRLNAIKKVNKLQNDTSRWTD